jgi:hypothetical protein
MDQEESLKNERLERVLSPHPLSFMKLQFLCIFLIIWGVILLWLVNFSDYKDPFGYWIPIVIIWALILILFSIIASILTIRWIIFFLYLGLVAGGIGLMALFTWYDAAGFFLPIWSVCMSILGFLFVEVYRRSHKYLISNLRIVFSGGIFTKRERTLRYDKISDINSEQGILGQIFGFGTIIPISQSGFGLGTDQSFAAGGVKLGEKKVGILGLFGGGREVQTPRARSYYELHGVHPYKEIKKLVESAVQESVITPYQQEQVAYQKEQVDVQKQMRDLLKKQMGPKETEQEEKNPPD